MNTLIYVLGFVLIWALFTAVAYKSVAGTTKRGAAGLVALFMFAGLGVTAVIDTATAEKAEAVDACTRSNPCGAPSSDTAVVHFKDGTYKNVYGWEAPDKVQRLAQRWIDNHPTKAANMRNKNGNGVFDWIKDKMSASTCLAGPVTGYYTDGYCQSWLNRKHPEASGQDGSTIEELRNIQFKCGGSVVIGAFGGKKWAPVAIGTGYTTCLYNNVFQTK